MREEMRSHSEIARLARRQHGVVSRRQLLALGILGERDRPYDRRRPSSIPSTAAPTPSATRGSRTTDAASRRCSPAAATPCSAISRHRGSGVSGAQAPQRIDVTVADSRSFPRFVAPPPRRRRSRTGTGRSGRAFRSPPCHGPCSTSARRRPADYRGAIERAEQLEMFDLTEVERMLGRCGGHHGRGALVAAIAGYRRSGLHALRVRAPVSQARPRGGPSATVGEHASSPATRSTSTGRASGSGSNSTPMTSTAARSRSSGTGCARRI